MAASSSLERLDKSGGQYRYEAFLSHEGSLKRGILSILLQSLDLAGKRETVFYDDDAVRGGTINDMLIPQLKKALGSSRRLVVFLTPEFLEAQWPFWELTTYLDMMEYENRENPGAADKKILVPIFYRVSARECKDLSRADPASESLKANLCKNPLYRDGKFDIERMQKTLELTVGILGINAQQENAHLNDFQVLQRVKKDVFGIDDALPPQGLVEASRQRTRHSGEFYKVRPGDTLWHLAKRFYGNPAWFAVIFKANNLEDCNRIKAGEWLWIPKFSP